MRRWIIVAAAIDRLGRAPARVRESRRKVLLVVAIAAVLGALFGGVLRLAWPAKALATVPVCTVPPYGQDWAADGYHAGMRSSQMTIEDYATTCLEVDSIGMLGPQGASLELGARHDGAYTQECDGTGQISTPYLFAVHVAESGAYTCKRPSGQSVTPWDKEGFSMQDQDQSGNYQWAHNGNNFPDPFGKTLEWTKGTVVTNSERHHAADSAWGHFESNFFMSVTSGWTQWDSSAYCYLNNNNNGNTHFFQQIWSPSNITVSTGSQVCP